MSFIGPSARRLSYLAKRSSGWCRARPPPDPARSPTAALGWEVLGLDPAGSAGKEREQGLVMDEEHALASVHAQQVGLPAGVLRVRLDAQLGEELVSAADQGHGSLGARWSSRGSPEHACKQERRLILLPGRDPMTNSLSGSQGAADTRPTCGCCSSRTPGPGLRSPESRALT
jgi:hypothetical protein